ncbi:MAG: C39 family peptidase [Pseudoramibacter sp.]
MRSKSLNVPLIDQTEKWPTGCESVSAVMALQYLGLDLSVDDFIQLFLDQRPMHLDQDPELVGDVCIGTGPDPNVYFAGSPYQSDAFGCYPGVIVKACNAVFRALRAPYRAIDGTGCSTQACLQAIDQGLPVIYWATLCFEPAVFGPKWQIEGREDPFTWMSREHCLVLSGYDLDAHQLIFNDPWAHRGRVRIDRALAEKRHHEQGERAVFIEKRQ